MWLLLSFSKLLNNYYLQFRVYDKKTGNAKAVNGGAKMQD